MMPNASRDEQTPAQRLRVFVVHLGLYFGVMILLAPANFYFSPNNLWVIFPMIGWGSVLALHVAYVMGLFRLFAGKTE